MVIDNQQPGNPGERPNLRLIQGQVQPDESLVPPVDSFKAPHEEFMEHSNPLVRLGGKIIHFFLTQGAGFSAK